MYTWLDITALEPEEAKISVLGIPFDGGQTQEPGAAKGPAKVREFAEKFMPGPMTGTCWNTSLWYMTSAMWT